jgi:hypothetical protein
MEVSASPTGAPGTAVKPATSPAPGPAANSAPAAGTPGASGPATPVPPRIVYHVNKMAAFTRREGPPELEEWEYDAKAFIDLQKKSDKATGTKYDALTAEIKKRFGQPARYCWPHDVYHPCDLE